MTFPGRADAKTPKTVAFRGFSCLLALVLVIAGCGDDAADRLNATVHTFADALGKGDASAAAAVTTDPAQASDTLVVTPVSSSGVGSRRWGR